MEKEIPKKLTRKRTREEAFKQLKEARENYDGSIPLKTEKNELYAKLKAAGRSSKDIYEVLFPEEKVPNNLCTSSKLLLLAANPDTKKRIFFLRNYYNEELVEEGLLTTKLRRKLLADIAIGTEYYKPSDRIKAIDLDAKLVGEIKGSSDNALTIFLDDLRNGKS